MSTCIFDLKVYLHQSKLEVDNLLNQFLPPENADSLLNSAIRYSVLNNGKRIRPILAMLVGEVLDLSPENVQGAALSLELIHCYSLIHDDLPAMDDDDLRRGVPTCHKAFDEATAILAGDAIQALAFAILSDPKWTPLPAKAQIALVRALAKAAGMHGMVLGQALDLGAEHKQLDLKSLQQLHALKTGALFDACVSMPLLCSPQPIAPTLQNQLQTYAKHLGLAFQIQDDILDVVGDQALIGKPVGSDQKHHKATFTSILGLDGAKEHLTANMQQALQAIAPLGEKGIALTELAKFLISRTY